MQPPVPTQGLPAALDTTPQSPPPTSHVALAGSRSSSWLPQEQQHFRCSSISSAPHAPSVLCRTHGRHGGSVSLASRPRTLTLVPRRRCGDTNGTEVAYPMTSSVTGSHHLSPTPCAPLHVTPTVHPPHTHLTTHCRTSISI